jgi:hypothetical protein
MEVGEDLRGAGKKKKMKNPDSNITLSSLLEPGPPREQVKLMMNI